MRVSADAGPLHHGGASTKKHRGADAHAAGAVDLLRGRVAALRAGEDRAPKTWVGGDGELLGLHSCLAGGCRDAAPAPAPASFRTPPWRVL